MSRTRCALVSSLLFAASLGYAQTSTGQITGTVLDPSGAVVPNAHVRVLGAETGDVVRDLVTDATGRFSAPLLRPTNYTVEVTANGFKKLVRTRIDLRVDEVLNLRLTIEPGIAVQSVTVSASVEALEEKTHSVGQVVDEKVIQQLPLNGRNYLQLGNLTAGAIPSTRSRDRTFSAYGNRGLQNAFLLDGARNQSFLRGLDNRQRDAVRPSLEALAEFKVQTSNFSAEYGASAGAIVNVVTKSGTNKLHGSAFEFLRNNAFDARNFFQPASSPTPLYIQHQFGGALGGPFVQNRAWWHAAVQRTHISQSQTYISTLPPAAQLGGAFGSLAVFDPDSTRPNPAGSGAIRDVFPGNAIPATRLDPIGRKLAGYYPQPNLPGAARNFVNNPVDSTRLNSLTVRGDLRLTNADSMFGRLSLDRGTYLRNASIPEPANTGTRRNTPADSIGYGYTRVFGSRMVNEFRLAWNHVEVDQDGTLAKDEIIPGALAPLVNSSIPAFNLSGYAGLGAQPPDFGNIPLSKTSGVWNISDNFSLVRTKHSLKAGYDYQILRLDTFTTLNGRGTWAFSGVFSQNPLARPGTGSPVADLLLGLPNTITTGTTTDARERAHNMYWYFQDDWSVTPTLTLNMGLRYELTRPFFDVNNKLANLVLDRGDPLYGQYVLAGDPRLPRALESTDRNNFAPRFGFAWRTPAPNLVVRGGYGIFFGQDEGFGVSQRMTNNPPFVGLGGLGIASDQLYPASTIRLSAPLPPRPAPVSPQDFRFNPNDTTRIQSWPGRYTISYVQQWTLGVQKQLPADMLWEVNYVGNRGLGLWGVYEGNQPLPGPGSVTNRRPLASITRGSVRRAEPWVKSAYHGLSTRLEKRFSHGLSFLAAYMFGKVLDTQTNVDLCDGCGVSTGYTSVQDTRNMSGNYGLADHDVRHRFVLNGLYQLPFGKGRPLATSGAPAYILGNWEISGIFSISSGLPFTPSLSFDNANTGTTSWPNRLRSGQLDNPTIDRYFDTEAFVFPPQYTFGNAGRNILIGPGVSSIDLSLTRSFRLPLNEVSLVDFRAEAFNLFNHPLLDVPGSTLQTPTFGVITATTQPNRQLQFGLKFVF